LPDIVIGIILMVHLQSLKPPLRQTLEAIVTLNFGRPPFSVDSSKQKHISRFWDDCIILNEYCWLAAGGGVGRNLSVIDNQRVLTQLSHKLEPRRSWSSINSIRTSLAHSELQRAERGYQWISCRSTQDGASQLAVYMALRRRYVRDVLSTRNDAIRYAEKNNVRSKNWRIARLV